MIAVLQRAGGASMSMNEIATRAEDGADPLGEKIRDYILGVENIRAENHRLLDHIATLETANLALESEVRSLNLALIRSRMKSSPGWTLSAAPSTM